MLPDFSKLHMHLKPSSPTDLQIFDSEEQVKNANDQALKLNLWPTQCSTVKVNELHKEVFERLTFFLMMLAASNNLQDASSWLQDATSF